MFCADDICVIIMFADCDNITSFVYTGSDTSTLNSVALGGMYFIRLPNML